MTISGLGQDSYVRIQKEVTYGTGITNSMTDLPCLSGSSFDAINENIENANMINSRVMQAPDQGRGIVRFAMQLNLPYSLLGELVNLFLGASADATVVDSTYTHTFLTPITGSSIGKSFTMQVAKGSATAEQYVGCVIDAFKITADSQGQVKAFQKT